MTKYFNIEYDNKNRIMDAIKKIDSSKVILKINSIKVQQESMLKIEITNRTSDKYVCDDFIKQLSDYLNSQN